MPTKGHASYLLYNIRILFNHPCAKVVILPETTKYFGKNLNDTLETPDIPDIPDIPGHSRHSGYSRYPGHSGHPGYSGYSRYPRYPRHPGKSSCSRKATPARHYFCCSLSICAFSASISRLCCSIICFCVPRISSRAAAIRSLIPPSCTNSRSRLARKVVIALSTM